MKFTIERSLLLKSLNHIQSVVERRNTIPVLSNVRMEVVGSVLTLKATDMELEIEESIPAVVAEKGATTTNAHTLYDIIRKLPDGSDVAFVFAKENMKLDISAGRSKFSLSCLPAEDFPSIASEEAMPFSFSLNSEQLKALIDRTKFAISTEETRYYLNGIFLHTADSDKSSVMRSAATDGHRLAYMEVSAPKGSETMPGIIIPRKTVNEVRKLIEDFADDVTVSLSENMIRFNLADVVFSSKLIDGNYPDYEKVIPSKNNKLMDTDTKLFMSAVDRVSVVSEKTKGVRLSLTKSSLVISSSNPEEGSATEEIDISFDGEPLDIGFNYRYLLDILGEIKGDTVRFALSDSASPAVIHDIADKSALYVLMPMRV